MDTEANTFPDPLLQQHQPATVAPVPRRGPGRVRGWTISGVLVLVLIVTIVYLAIGQIPQETPPIEADRWCLASNAQFSSQIAHVSSLSQIVAITTSNLLTDVSMVTIKDGKIWLVGNGPGSSGDSQNWFILDNC